MGARINGSPSHSEPEKKQRLERGVSHRGPVGVGARGQVAYVLLAK